MGQVMDVPSPLTWDEYFIRMTDVVASKSKDPTTQVGCLLVDADHNIISTGYNGMPRGIRDTQERWYTDEKYKLVMHAEGNALSRYIQRASGSEAVSLYVSCFPCLACAKQIVASGIKRVVISCWERYTEEVEGLFLEAGIQLVQELG
jgi:dCMP deaminase